MNETENRQNSDPSSAFQPEEIQLHIGNRYCLSFSSVKPAEHTKTLLSTIFAKLENFTSTLNLQDFNENTKFEGDLNSILSYIQKSNKVVEDNSFVGLKIDSNLFKTKNDGIESLFKKYEFLNLDETNNLEKLKEFLKELLEIACLEYKEDKKGFKFTEYIGGLLKKFKSNLKNENKENLIEDSKELNNQRKKLSQLLKINKDEPVSSFYTRIEQIFDRTKSNVEKAILEAEKLINSQTSFDHKEDLLKHRQTLYKIKTEFRESLPLEEERKDDGQFLPFHLVKTKLKLPTRNGSKNSISYQTSRCYFSEKVSYESDDDLMDLEELSKREVMRRSSNHPLAKVEEHIKKNRSSLVQLKPHMCISEREEHMDCSINEVHQKHQSFLETENLKLKGILADLGIMIEEHFREGEKGFLLVEEDELREKIGYFVDLENNFNDLNLKFLKLQEKIKKEEKSSEFNKILNEDTFEQEKKQIYKELVEEKTKNNNLTSLNNQLKQKERRLINKLKNKLKPMMEQYRKEFNTYKMLVEQSMLKKDIENYRDLIYKGVQNWKACYSFRKIEFGDLLSATELHLTERTIKPNFIDRSIIHDKLSKLLHMLSTFNHDRYDNLLKSLCNKLATLQKKYKSNVNFVQRRFEDLLIKNELLEKELEENQQTQSALKEQYKLAITDLNKELEERTDNILDLEQQLKYSLEREKELTNKKDMDRIQLEGEIRKKESILFEKDKLLIDIQTAVDKKDKVLLKKKSDSINSENQLEKMQIMNTKLLSELNILNKQLKEAKAARDELEEKLNLFEDQEQIMDELSLANKMLKNRFELQDDGNIYRSDSNEKYEETRQGLYTKKDTPTDFRESDSSIGGFNKTIEEVSEKFELSEMDNSMDLRKKFTSTREGVISGSLCQSHRNKLTDQSPRRSLAIQPNYSYLQDKDNPIENSTVIAEIKFDSPIQKKKNLFCRSKLMKSIEAMAKSKLSSKLEHKNEDSLYSNSVNIQKNNNLHKKINKLKELLRQCGDIEEIITKDNRISLIVERIKKLEFVLIENKTKKNSLREESDCVISKRNSQTLDLSRTESRKSNNVISSIINSNKASREKLNRSSNTNQKRLFNNSRKKKTSKSAKDTRLEKLKKAYGRKPLTSSPNYKKGLLKEVKSNIFKSTLNNKTTEYKVSNHNRQKSVGDNSGKNGDNSLLQFDVKIKQKENEFIKEKQELLVLIEKLNKDIDCYKSTSTKLQEELDELQIKNLDNEEIINQFLATTEELINNKIEKAELNPSYIDQIMEAMKEKMENYEKTIISLEEEIDLIRNDNFEENRIENIPTPERPSMSQNRSDMSLNKDNFVEKQKMVKAAFEELMTNMFTVVTDNLTFIENLEELVIPLKEDKERKTNNRYKEDSNEKEKIETLNIVFEIDKLKTNTINLKDMIECMFDNLMEFLDELHDMQLYGTTEGEEGDKLPMEENAALNKKIEIMTEDYKILNEKYIEMMNENHQRKNIIESEQLNDSGNRDSREMTGASLETGRNTAIIEQIKQIIFIENENFNKEETIKDLLENYYIALTNKKQYTHKY